MSISARAWVAAAALVALVPVVTAAREARRPYRIGVLSEAWSANHPTVEGLKAGLKDLGLVEGRDVTFDIRFTEGQRADMFNVATALVVGGVDLIFTSGEPATRAAADASQKIPIVFTQVGDPVSGNIRKSWVYARENITGVSSLTTRLVPKRLEVLKTLAPTLRRVWAIYPAAEGSAMATVREATEAAPRLKLEVVGRPAWTPEDVDRDLRSVRQGDGLLVPDVTIMDIPVKILEKSIASRLPAVFPSTLWVEHGGLVSYGADYRGEGLQAARLVAKILRGARPQDLPIEGAEKIDLAVNLKTAGLLGVQVPRKVLLRAEWILR